MRYRTYLALPCRVIISHLVQYFRRQLPFFNCTLFCANCILSNCFGISSYTTNTVYYWRGKHKIIDNNVSIIIGMQSARFLIDHTVLRWLNFWTWKVQSTLYMSLHTYIYTLYLYAFNFFFK